MTKSVVIFFMLAVFIYACKHTVQTPGGTPGGTDTTGTGGNPGPGDTTGTGGTPGNTLVCFESQILPIFTSNCAKSGCHGVGSSQEGYVLDSYDNIMNSNNDGIEPGDPDDSEIYEVITEDDPSKRMPQGQPPLPAAQIALIKIWIEEGAQNTTNCGTACNDNLFTYSGAVKPIVDTYCAGCHSGPATPNRPNLTTYSGILDVAQPGGRLLGAINHAPGFTPMPQSGPKLNACQISQITKWVNTGAPNN